MLLSYTEEKLYDMEKRELNIKKLLHFSILVVRKKMKV